MKFVLGLGRMAVVVDMKAGIAKKTPTHCPANCSCRTPKRPPSPPPRRIPMGFQRNPAPTSANAPTPSPTEERGG